MFRVPYLLLNVLHFKGKYINLTIKHFNKTCWAKIVYKVYFKCCKLCICIPILTHRETKMPGRWYAKMLIVFVCGLFPFSVSLELHDFFFFFLRISLYLFIYFFGCVGSSFLCEGFLQLQQAGATLHRGARASHHRSLSLRSTGSRRASPAVVAHGPSCSAARGTLPDQGPNPCPLHWQADSQPLRHQGSPYMTF